MATNEQIEPWGADVPVSMPHPIDPDIGDTVDLGGFVMTHQGFRVNMTETDREALLAQQYKPKGMLRGRA